jgi:hypothetical protein
MSTESDVAIAIAVVSWVMHQGDLEAGRGTMRPA